MAKENNNNNGASFHNALTSGSKVVGTITADSDFRIDGHVEGDLTCKGKVVVGQKGYIKGTIDCMNAEIYGTVDGKMTVSETLTLRQTAVVTGEINIGTLIIEPNAAFNGTCVMNNKTNTNPTKTK
jgi:cytoskeletal protein CcmA (bactofilin family)